MSKSFNTFETVISSLFILAAFILELYRANLLPRLNSEQNARRMKAASRLLFAVLTGGIVYFAVELLVRCILLLIQAQFTIQMLVYSGIISAAGTLILFFYLLFENRVSLEYFRTQSLETLVAGFFLRKHTQALSADDIPAAYSFLAKACEASPDNIELVTRLAFFNEVGMDDPAKATECLRKAARLLQQRQNADKKDIACYEGRLGGILWRRGKNLHALKHLKRAIDHDPNPIRIEDYNEKIAILRRKTNVDPVPLSHRYTD